MFSTKAINIAFLLIFGSFLRPHGVKKPKKSVTIFEVKKGVEKNDQKSVPSKNYILGHFFSSGVARMILIDVGSQLGSSEPNKSIPGYN